MHAYSPGFSSARSCRTGRTIRDTVLYSLSCVHTYNSQPVVAKGTYVTTAAKQHAASVNGKAIGAYYPPPIYTTYSHVFWRMCTRVCIYIYLYVYSQRANTHSLAVVIEPAKKCAIRADAREAHLDPLSGCCARSRFFSHFYKYIYI